MRWRRLVCIRRRRGCVRGNGALVGAVGDALTGVFSIIYPICRGAAFVRRIFASHL